MSSQLEPIAFEASIVGRPFQGRQDTGPERPGLRLILRFASLAVVVDAQVEQTRALPSVKDCATTVLEGSAEHAAWDALVSALWDAPGAIVSASWLPADLAAAINACASSITELTGRAAIGGGLIRIDGDAQQQAAAIARLRQSKSFHNIVVLRGSDELKSMVDVWGIQPDRARLFASLKTALDPHNTLNAGRGPL
jgi:hypothetical protein